MNWKKHIVGTWSWKRPFYSLGFVYIAMMLFVVIFADRLIFIPPPPGYSEHTPDVQKIRTASGKSMAFFHLKAQPGMPTLLYSHGNAEDISMSMELYQAWRARGLGILTYDYPGYGLSEGRATEESCEETIQSAWDHLVGSGIKPSSIIIVGRSVGSGPSVWLAAKEKPAGLALISPFTSTFAVGIPLPFGIFPCDRFPNLKRIKNYSNPLLTIHGTNDEVIPYSHSLKLMAACPAKDKVHHPITPGGHNDLFMLAGTEIVDQVTDFALRISPRIPTK